MTTEAKYDVFLSYNADDSRAVEAIARRLRQETKLKPFLDRWHLIPGRPWQEEIEQALTQSATIAVFAGPSRINPWQNEEMRIGLDQAVRSRDDVRVIPVLLPGVDEASLPPFVQRRAGPDFRAGVDFRSGLDDASAFTRLVAGILGEPSIEDSASTLADEPAPYRGLAQFTSKQQGFFFGRSEEITRLRQRLRTAPFAAVVGASGSGKSSLVLAGLLPELDYRSWHLLTLTPGYRPLRSLADQMATLTSPAARLDLADSLEQRLQERVDGLTTAASSLLSNHTHDKTLLIVVDQFEELFTQTTDEMHQQQFIANLMDVTRAGSGRMKVIITLRADFIQHCLAFPDLPSLLEANQLLLGPLSEEGLREAIVRPAQERGAMFEKGLVARLMDEMRHRPGALPLLQFALVQLWQARRGTWMTHDAYEAIGRVSGAIEQQAESIYLELDEEEQQLVHNLFVRLVTLGEEDNGRNTRRRVQREELNLVGTTPAEQMQLIDKFSQQSVRLITADEDGIEVTHEALIGEWSRLRAWLDEERAGLILHRRLTHAARVWKQQGQNPSYLYRGEQLTQVKRRVPVSEMSLLENEFVKASENAWKAQTRATYLRRLILLAFPVLLLLALLFPTANGTYLEQIQQARLWQTVAQFPDDGVLAIVAGNSGAPIVYVGTENAAFAYSVDEGMTWVTHSAGLPTTTGEAATGAPGELVRSVDRIAVDACESKRIFAGVVANGVYKLENRGQAWQSANGDLPNPQRNVRSIAAYDNYVFAVIEVDFLEFSLYASSNGGDNWQEIREQTYSVYTPPCRDGSIELYAGSVDGLYRTSITSPGEWQHVVELPPVILIAPGTGDDRLYLATYDFATFDGALYSWQLEEGSRQLATFTGREPRALALHPGNAGSVYMVLDDGSVVKISADERKTSLGKPFGLAQISDLLVISGSNERGTRLFLGTSGGLREYQGQLD